MKYHGKTSLNINILIKNEGQEVKTGPVSGWITVGGRRVNRKDEGR
jgi:hypothetical protein